MGFPLTQLPTPYQILETLLRQVHVITASSKGSDTEQVSECDVTVLQ